MLKERCHPEQDGGCTLKPIARPCGYARSGDVALGILLQAVDQYPAIGME
jgi:hypothetical protein